MIERELTIMPSLVWSKRIKRYYDKIAADSFDCIDHFAVNLILPDKTIVTICPNYNYFIDYKNLHIERVELGLSPWKIDNSPVVPWRLILNKNDSKRFNQLVHFKEKKHNLHSGMTFVNKIDDCYLTVGVATNKKDPKYALSLMQNMEEILNMGAYLYDVFKPELQALYEREFPELNKIVLNDKQYLIAERFSKKWVDSNIFTL